MQFSQSFNKLLNNLYDKQEKDILKSISHKVDSFFNVNQEVSALVKNRLIATEGIISKISNETLTELLTETVETLFKTNRKINIGVAFHYSNYIIYLLKKLEKEERDNKGSILGVKFLKKLQNHSFKKEDIFFNYDLVFSDKEILVGYRYNDIENKEVEFIHKSYYEVILEDVSEHFKEKANEQEQASKLLEYIINRQLNRYMNISYFYIEDFKNMLKYSYVISVDENPQTLEQTLTTLNDVQAQSKLK